MGDKQYAGMSFEQVVQKYKNTVGAVCVMRLNNRSDADDCFQNTSLSGYLKNPPILKAKSTLKRG